MHQRPLAGIRWAERTGAHFAMPADTLAAAGRPAAGAVETELTRPRDFANQCYTLNNVAVRLPGVHARRRD